METENAGTTENNTMKCSDVCDNKVKAHLKKILILDAFPLSED